MKYPETCCPRPPSGTCAINVRTLKEGCRKMNLAWKCHFLFVVLPSLQWMQSRRQAPERSSYWSTRLNVRPPEFIIPAFRRTRCELFVEAWWCAVDVKNGSIAPVKTALGSLFIKPKSKLWFSYFVFSFISLVSVSQLLVVLWLLSIIGFCISSYLRLSLRLRNYEGG